ncbi:MAG: hypothetical protein KBE09_05260 [Candidatus Pacebacteria bacterium]|nr:hypothetical protein [Candidatus Paceibacterota bacterium]
MPGAGAVGLFFSTVWNKILVPACVMMIIAGVTAWFVYRITRNERAAQVAGVGALVAGYTGFFFLK